mgnify:CR=1 FL=1
MLVKSVIWSGDVIIKPIGDRLYEIYEPISVQINTNNGRMVYNLDENFKFDGRSGGAIVDLVGIPNLGKQPEVKAWLLHDLLYHDVGFSRKEADDLLLFCLRFYANYSWLKRTLAYSNVRALGYWAFGEPKPGSLSAGNMEKIHRRFYAK